MALTKADLIDSVASKTELSKTQVQEVMDATFNGIIEGIKTDSDRKVSIAGFGIFTAKDRAAREGRNPATGETIQIKASVAAGWKPAKQVKDTLNNK